jgi:hypothetical protein
LESNQDGWRYSGSATMGLLPSWPAPSFNYGADYWNCYIRGSDRCVLLSLAGHEGAVRKIKFTEKQNIYFF